MTVTFKAEKKFKKLLKDIADKECRSVSSFIIHAIVTYLKDYHKIDWHELKDKPPKKKTS